MPFELVTKISVVFVVALTMQDALSYTATGTTSLSMRWSLRSGVFLPIAGSITRWYRHGKISTDGACQKLFNFVVPGNGFLASGLRIDPDGVTATFAMRHTTVLL